MNIPARGPVRCVCAWRGEPHSTPPSLKAAAQGSARERALPPATAASTRWRKPFGDQHGHILKSCFICLN